MSFVPEQIRGDNHFLTPREKKYAKRFKKKRIRSLNRDLIQRIRKGYECDFDFPPERIYRGWVL